MLPIVVTIFDAHEWIVPNFPRKPALLSMRERDKLAVLLINGC